MKGACGGRGGGESDHRPQSCITILANQAWESQSGSNWLIRKFRNTDSLGSQTVRVSRVHYRPNLLYFCFSEFNQELPQLFKPSSEELRKRSKPGNCELLSRLNGTVWGCSEIRTEIAGLKYVQNSACEVWDCQRFSSCGPQVAVRAGLSLGVAWHLEQTLCFRVKQPKNNFSCAATRL